MRGLAERWCRDQSAVTIVEYGLLLALISLVVAAASQTIAAQISTVFSKVGTYLSSASAPSSP